MTLDDLEMERRVSVEGFSHYNGSIDGKDIDSLKVYILEQIKGNQSSKTGGQRTVEYKMQGAREVAARLVGLSFPAECTIKIAITSVVRDGVTVPDIQIKDIVPVKPAQLAKAS